MRTRDKITLCAGLEYYSEADINCIYRMANKKDLGSYSEILMAKIFGQSLERKVAHPCKEYFFKAKNTLSKVYTKNHANGRYQE